MKITPKFTTDDIKKLVLSKADRIELAILLRLQRIGEQFVTDARNNGSYTDRTGNLRSSVGYVVLRNGEQYSKGGFEKIKAGGKGVETGNRIVLEAATKFPVGLVLIVVAGMNYAAAVEAKGRDVLTGSSQAAIVSLKDAMKKIGKKAA